MPYYHTKDNAKIHFWRRKCSKCSRKWPVSALFSLTTPEGMVRAPAKEYKVKVKGPTTYASWADRVPFVSVVASRLPNWPRWARLLSFCIVVSGLGVGVYFLSKYIWGF